MNYVIVGGGIAGVTAAEELRRLSADAQITLISDEYHPLYSRVLLPRYVLGQIERERVFLKKETWYEEQKIEWIRGILVLNVDTRNKFVSISDGREIPYDKLLIATGAQARSLDFDLRGVSYFRSLDDADHLLQLIHEQAGDAQAVVYGSGFIASDYISLFDHFKFPTKLVFRADYLWAKNLLPQVGDFVTKHLRDSGIDVCPNTQIKDLIGDQNISGVLTTNGEYPCTILGCGIGTEADFSWLADSDIQTGIGIFTNEFLETNVPDVYAAGDIAEFYDSLVSRRIRVGNWMNAMSQGRISAMTMSGKRTKFELVSSYATNLLGFEIIFVGDTQKATADRISTVGSTEMKSITQVFVRGGRIVGGVMIGRNQDRKIVTDGILEKREINDLIREMSG